MTEDTKTINQIVQEALVSSDFTLREMALELGVSHPTIINWRDGRSQPKVDFLIRCQTVYKDWRRDFATACLHARMPDVF